jgi:hypothetical protein
MTLVNGSQDLYVEFARYVVELTRYVVTSERDERAERDDGQGRADDDRRHPMTRRPAHGGSARPQFSRPGNGYGRPLKPRPAAAWRVPDAHRTDWYELLLHVATDDAQRASA